MALPPGGEHVYFELVSRASFFRPEAADLAWLCQGRCYAEPGSIAIGLRFASGPTGWNMSHKFWAPPVVQIRAQDGGSG